MDDETEARADELVGVLRELEHLLRRHREMHWADWVALDRARIEHRDPHGPTHLLSAFGGMSSLTDLVIHPSNGHLITDEEIGSVNQALMGLRARADVLAEEITRRLARGSERVDPAG